jgi:hypothetical protein
MAVREATPRRARPIRRTSVVRDVECRERARRLSPDSVWRSRGLDGHALRRGRALIVTPSVLFDGTAQRNPTVSHSAH